MEDYIVRFGNNSSINRSDYMNEKDANKFYDKLKLDVNITWKELIHEPLDIPDKQEICRSDSVRVIDLGFTKFVIGGTSHGNNR